MFLKYQIKFNSYIIFYQVEQERDIVRQSSKSAEVSTPRKNHCLLRKDQELLMKPKTTPIVQGTFNSILSC